MLRLHYVLQHTLSSAGHGEYLMARQPTKAESMKHVSDVKAVLGDRYEHRVIEGILFRRAGLLTELARLAFSAGRNGTVSYNDWLDAEATHLHIRDLPKRGAMEAPSPKEDDECLAS
jgi:hypothetical protein